MKQAPATVSFSVLSPMRDNESDMSSITSAEASESENEEKSSEEENIEGDFSILEELLNKSDEDSSHENESLQEQDFSHALTQADLYNELKVYSGSELSVNEGILRIMNLYVKNKLSKAGLHRAIQTICAFLPDEHNVPVSSHLILDYIERLAPPVSADIHYCCRSCLFYHGTSFGGHCQVCGPETEFGHFYCFDIAALIKFFFESRNLASIMDLEERNSTNSTAIRSIKDGSVYQSLNANRGKYDISIIFGSDGVRIRKGSTKELWLALFTIAELPLHLQKSFMTVIGVWYDEKKPDMKTFLKPFAEKMETLDPGNENSVQWTHPVTRAVHKSFVRFLVSVLDAPARAIVQNTLHFNGRYGCSLCEIKSQLTERVPGVKRVRVYYYVDKPKLRTKERMLKQAQEVGEQKHVKGVKGPSVLNIIPSVDVSQCIVPEYMHSVLLGVVKQQLVIWTSKEGTWSLKNRVTEIDIFLNTFKHPDFVHRSLRQLKSLKYWKAADLYYFLFFESLVTLRAHLPDQYLQHFTLLVKGIFTLLKSSITEAEIAESEILLKLFVNDFGRLYGSRELTSNVHQLLHLPLCVRRYGGLHCFSAFSFEDLNGLIAKATHGTNHVDAEIVNNITICQGVHMLQNIVSGHGGVSGCNACYSAGQLLGKEVSTLAPEELVGILEDVRPKIFSRAKLGYDVFTSEIHKILTSENFHVMWTENGLVRYGSIKYFAETSDEKFVVLRLYTVDHTRVFYHRESLKCIEHLVPVKASSQSVVIRFSDIVPSIVKVGKIGSVMYKRPNLYRFVM